MVDLRDNLLPITAPRIGTPRDGFKKADLLPSTSEIQDVLPIPHMSRQEMCLPSGLVYSSFWNLIIFRTVHLLRSVSSIFIHSLISQIFILQTIWAKPWKFRFIKHDPSPQVTYISSAGFRQVTSSQGAIQQTLRSREMWGGRTLQLLKTLERQLRGSATMPCH